MNLNERQTDKLICCGGILLMSIIAVTGYMLHDRDIAFFGTTGFLTFSGPLFMVMNRELGNGNGNGSGSANPTLAKENTK